MKNPEPKMIALPINAAHLLSLSGMLRQFAPRDMFDVFSAQIAMQAGMQGLNIYSGGEDTNYDLLMTMTVNFSIPTVCVADVGRILLNAHKDNTNKAMQAALSFLIEQWAPFAIEALKAEGSGSCPHGYPTHNRLSDLGPEYLN